MNNPSICILVLNWNGVEDTLACLVSLGDIRFENVRIVVIDNGSTDDSVEQIHKQFPAIHIIELKTNLFYGGGNNAGLQWANEHNYEYVIFLNNDTTVDPNFIEPLIDAFNHSETVGMVAPLMCYSALPETVWYGGGVVNLWTGTIAHRSIRASIHSIPPESKETDYITGCCLMMRTALAIEFAGFDPDFQMYGEDVDLSLRIRNAGYRLVFVPQSKIFHKVSASVGGEFSGRKITRKLHGLFQIYSRHAAWYQWITIVFSQGVLSIRYLLTYILNKSAAGTKSLPGS
ncbi:MAG: glycosyltransferase family 2 protein [Candidatus Marinimicrobia bacterium]|nr:glycosyltransferase family 2 protein [Candidatus Neomarinimicrobiota bacterium]